MHPDRSINDTMCMARKEKTHTKLQSQWPTRFLISKLLCCLNISGSTRRSQIIIINNCQLAQSGYNNNNNNCSRAGVTKAATAVFANWKGNISPRMRTGTRRGRMFRVPLDNQRDDAMATMLLCVWSDWQRHMSFLAGLNCCSCWRCWGAQQFYVFSTARPPPISHLSSFKGAERQPKLLLLILLLLQWLLCF